MTKEEKERLNLLFELDNIKSYLVPYIAPGVNLKVVADLSWKDPQGNKHRFYNEIRYRSDKYKNVDHLISASYKLNTYLFFEYPNPNYSKDHTGDELRSNGIYINGYAIDDIVNNMKYFNSKVLNRCFGISNNDIIIYSDKVKSVEIFSNPYTGSSIEVTPDVYVHSQYGKCPGVRFTMNKEYSFIVDADNTWLEIIYRLSRCDLTMLGFQMIQSFLSMLPGNAVSDIESGGYKGSSRYAPYYEDPDDICNSNESVSIKQSKNTNAYKKHIFDL